MHSLHLIKMYSSDSDEDNQNKTETNDDRIVKKLPLPTSILSWKGVTYHDQVVDNPLDHDGRIRSIKHERGNWATLIYIKYTASDCLRAWMNSVLTDYKLPIQGNIISHLHISLSRTLILKFHWIEAFIESLKMMCYRFNQFVVHLTDVRVYCNEEKTRTFLGIYCQNEEGMLKHLTETLDNLLTEYQLPLFYKDTSYHISFFWCLGDKQACLKEILPLLTCNLNKCLAESLEDTYIHVSEIQCKIGNKYYAFKLN